MQYRARLHETIRSQYPSLSAFARAVDRHRVIVSQVVHGHRNLDEEEQQAWADVLGCDAAILFP